MIKRKVYIVASDTHVVKLNGIHRRVCKHNYKLELKISTHNKIGTAKSMLTNILKEKEYYANGWYGGNTIEDIEKLQVMEVWEEYK